MFRVVLILVLPFYISDAYAQASLLTITRHSGDAGTDGFFDSYDRWILEVNAFIEGEDGVITPNQVKINNYSMQNCTEISPARTYKCSYVSAYYTISGGTYTSKVSLYSDLYEVMLQQKSINMTL